ncbi:MAG TPA: hypothetical protein VKN76_16455 [Kiloniellaceae bacterium]|nr:hypothetical protein [Kiloniellaceae bacterium]
MSLNLTRHAEVTRLLDQVEAVADALTANELELFRHLKAKYGDPGPGADDDKICLEVMLRNIEIRKGYGLDPKRDSGRTIELERRKDDES